MATTAAAAPVGQGFSVTPSDLAYILKQIKISEAHVANTNSATGPCGALVGTGPNQLTSPLLSFGLRTVDGTCNNLQPGQETYGAADEVFPRLGTKAYEDAQGVAGGFFGPGSPEVASSSYSQKSGNVFDTEPRTVSNLVVDQTSTNPAAIEAAGFPVRTQGNEGVVPCATPPAVGPDGADLACVPSHETLFIPNVTTDVGLSPPYNSMFTLFGQFFDHGIDQTVKGGGTVYVPLKDDDPLVAGDNHVFGDDDDLPLSQRFMVLTRGKNQPGPDGIQGNADDVTDAKNTDSPWIDQSQTYSSHPSHQVFLREYVNNAAGRPVSTGKLLGGPTGATAGGMATWARTKAQAATLLGLQLQDKDVTDVPMMAVDAYGKFIPGPARGLPQYVTAAGLIEGNVAAPVAVPADVRYFDTPFLTDIAHNADPSPKDHDHDPRTDPVAPAKDADTTASANFAAQAPGTYDDEMLNEHFIAGDGRVNENIGLTAIHQVFHSEHDRLVDDIERILTNDTSASGVAALSQWQLADGAGTSNWNGERLFQAARFITEMEYQHLVFEEFARKVQPGINPFQPFAFTQTDINPAVKAEFAHAVYRFGHSMLTETISRKNEDGSKNDVSLLKGFLNPPEYTNGGSAGTLTSEQAAGSVIMGMSDQVGNELDEFVTETLRNNLLGLPLDLAAINITRARSEGIPSLNNFRRELFASTNDGQLKPYTNWIDFGEHLKNPKSLVNFVAAYGKHPSITGAATSAAKREAARLIVNPDVLAVPADVPPVDAAAFMNSIGAWANTGTSSKTGLDTVDLWVGGLAEVTTPFGGLLGTTFNYVFENQMTELQNGDRLYYLARTPGMNLRAQLEGNSFAEMMMRNTTAQALKADSFATADCKFELKNLSGTAAGFGTFGNNVADDPASECVETDVLIRMADGTIQYRARNSVDPAGINGQSVYNGTPGVDRVYGGNDNDTFWGGLGNDILEGGGGADIALGGEGNDVITDLGGDDVPKGGPGNDAIDAGPGLDIIMAGEGKDFTNGGGNANETFGGEGDDFMILGDGIDAGLGDSGDDWVEGGNQPDLLIGDSSNLFFLDDSQMPGNDILIGQSGDDDYDMEGGNDIGVAGPGIEKVAGGSGYDWQIGLGDPQPQDLDLDLPIAPLDILTVGVRDRFNEAEALSGWKFDDKIRGDDLVPAEVGGGGFIGCDVMDQAGINRIAGLNALVPTPTTPLASVVAQSASKDCPILSGPVWGDGNILLGGGGSDLIEGRGANDIIDGDRYLGVRLSVRNTAGVEIGSASVEGTTQSAMTSQYLRVGGGRTGAFVPGSPTLQEAVFAGTVDAGNIVAVREILTGTGGTDTAVFSGLQADYTVTTTGGTGVLGSPGSTTTVEDTTGTDGIDTLRNIEVLQFSDTVTAPVTVAGAPTIGASTAGNASATANWTAPAANGGSAITGYVIRTYVGTSTTPLATTTTVGNVTTRLMGALTNGTAYRFDVAAINGAGRGAFSALSAAVTPRTEFVVPTVTARTPASGATNVSRTGNVTATFSEAVTGVSGTTFVLRLGTTVVPAGVTYNATTRVATLNPNATLLAGRIYTATLSSARDTAGNTMATTSWSFTTDAVPTITSTTPASGATGVRRNSNVTVRFSEGMTGTSATTVRITRVTSGRTVATARSFNAARTVLTINPTGSLVANAQYRVTITGGTTAVRDLTGNPLVSQSWVFRTGSAL